MKHIPQSKFFMLLCLFLVGQVASAQFNFFKSGSSSRRNRSSFTPYSSIGIGGGHSNYYGELANYSSVGSSIKNLRWNGSLDYTRQFTPRFAARFGFSYARLFADDANYGTDKPGLYVRNLHFRNDVKEFSITGMLSLTDMASRDFKRRYRFDPYVFGGIAVLAHEPKAKAPAEFDNIWVNLQPLSTEGQGLPGYQTQPYSLVQVAVPYGVGLKYRLSERFDISVELGMRHTFTDYLDDVGGTYPDPNDLQSDLARAMSNRSIEPVAAYSGQDRTAIVRQFLVDYFGFPTNADPFAQPIPGYSERGDIRGTNSRKDSYLLSVFKIHYIIAPKIKCPVAN